MYAFDYQRPTSRDAAKTAASGADTRYLAGGQSLIQAMRLRLSQSATLVDLDQVAGGPAAAELGSAVAGLRYDAVVGALDAGTARSLEHMLLDGYAVTAPLPREQTLRWYTAAALLAERALRAVNRVRPAGLLRLDEILDEARAIAP